MKIGPHRSHGEEGKNDAPISALRYPQVVYGQTHPPSKHLPNINSLGLNYLKWNNSDCKAVNLEVVILLYL